MRFHPPHPSWVKLVEQNKANRELKAKVGGLQEEFERRRANKEESSGESSELTDLLERKILELKKTQNELTTVTKELDRAKERLGKLGRKNADLENALQSSKDKAVHYKGLCDEANGKLKCQNQSVVDQLDSNKAALALRDEQVADASNKCRELEQQMRGAEVRCRDMALNVKTKQEIARKAEDHARELDVLMVQGAGKVRYDAIWGDFPDDDYERRLVYTSLPGTEPWNCHLTFCRDSKFKLLTTSRDQDGKVVLWKRNGWVVDRHIENSPQVVMKRIVGYVDDPSVNWHGGCPPWKQAAGC